MKSVFYQPWIVLVVIMVMVSTSLSQNQNSCKVSPFPETATNKFNDFMTKFGEFFDLNDLKKGHEKMRKVMDELKVPVIVSDEMPLQTYLVKYRQFLHGELDAKISKHEKKVKQNLDSLQQTIDESEARRNTFMNKQIEDLKLFFKNKMISLAIRPTNCLELLEAGEKKDGVYTIYIDARNFQVYCDMTTNGGGWTVFLSRQKQESQLDFNRDWQSYKNGFGNALREYWLGNEALHIMTKVKSYSARFDIEGRNGTPPNIWVEYSNFKVDSENQKYLLTLEGYDPKSTMKDYNGFGVNTGRFFTTFDVDNDNWPESNCAADAGGGFWLDYCSFSYPNRRYGKIKIWHWGKTDTNSDVFISSLQIKIRPSLL